MCLSTDESVRQRSGGMRDGYENYLEAEMVHGTGSLMAVQMERAWPSVRATSVSGLCRGPGESSH